jgi:hypothetical protein
MADSYGLLAISNTGDRTVLDSEFSRLTVLYTGRYVGNEEGGNSSATMFPAPITTQEQPLVFIRPDPANGIIGMSSLEVFGMAGNWTGFRIRIFNYYTIKPVGSWFVAYFGAQAIAPYGMRLRDASSNVIFDSGTPAAQFVRSNNVWTYSGSGSTAQGVSITFFTAPFTLGVDEYLLINNLTMNAVTGGSGSTQRQIATTWNYPARQLILALISPQNTISTGITVMTGRLAS